jgi:hypothetical protein
MRLPAGAGRLVVLVFMGAPFLSAGPSGAQTTTNPPAFSGSAAAGGVRVTVSVPGAPVTDTPVDGGGPTAQVAGDSLGSSTGYAAFPDPGQFVLSVPGLALGLLSGGVAGLPPVKLPSLPNYPLFVSSDASTAPQASVGSGPLALSAKSSQGSSQASATTGFQTGLVGNGALVSSTASLAPSASGAVVVSATTDFQGLSIGPLMLGEVKSTATETMDPSGTITPSTSLSLAGVRVGGVPVELGPQGLVVAGATYPLPINQTLNALLKASGITVQVVSAQQFPGRVVAPALQLTFPFTMPFKVPGLGQFSGRVTLIIGSATAQISGASSAGANQAGDGGPPGLLGASGSTPSGSDLGSGSTAGGSAPRDAGGSVGSPSPVAASVSPSPVADPALASSPTLSGGPRAGGRSAAASRLAALDVRSLYLVLLVGAIVLVGAGQVVRRLGG